MIINFNILRGYPCDIEMDLEPEAKKYKSFGDTLANLGSMKVALQINEPFSASFGVKHRLESHKYKSQMLSQHIGNSKYMIGKYGKPKPVIEAVDFNISHCARAVAFAISSRGKIGVDIEPRNRFVSSKIFKWLYNNREIPHAGSTAPAHRLIAWTLNEAFFKACGVGLQERAIGFAAENVLKGKVVNVGPQSLLYWCAFRRWVLMTLITERYVVSLAVRQNNNLINN